MPTPLFKERLVQPTATGVRRGWAYFLARLNAPTPNESLPDGHSEDPTLAAGSINASTYPVLRNFNQEQDLDDDDSPVDVVVVENDGFKCYKPVLVPDADPSNPATSSGTPNVDYNSSTAGGQNQSDRRHHSRRPTESVKTSDTDLEMNDLSLPGAHKSSGRVATRRDRFFRMIGWEYVRRFSSLSDEEKNLETEYWKEHWFSTKRLCILGGLWLVINWVLAVAFARRPMNDFDSIYFYLIAPICVLPLPFMIMADMPSGGNSVVYQLWLTAAVWNSGVFMVIDGYLCGFFGSHAVMTCGDKDFFNIIYYAVGLPSIALFALHQNRLPALIAVCVFLVLVLVMIVPHRPSFLRHVLEIGVFHIFLLYTNYRREQAIRRVFVLKEQMKVQFRAKQRAQIAERSEADSKRRLTNYIFHEVRVPLNTATLAFQNIEASGIITQDTSLEFTALGGSLSMMSKVLSDILDFNRMDEGRLVTVERPFRFHHALKSMLPGARIVANSRGLEVIDDFDPQIDIVARKALLTAHGLPESEIKARIADTEKPHDGIVSGDEMRIRQVVTNLLSNALKFGIRGSKATDANRVTLRTRLIKPDPKTLNCTDSSLSLSCLSDGSSPSSADGSGVEHEHKTREKGHKRRLDSIVIRIEVEDMGVGIRPKDIANHRLFSPFIQTEIGRSQGGKGTGLGLALVRHIVSLSGGRLGASSKAGVGSIFWIELALGVGQRALREPSWPEVGLSSNFGTDIWSGKLPYPSPDPSAANTPQFTTTETAVTPSASDRMTTKETEATDYISHKPIKSSTPPIEIDLTAESIPTPKPPTSTSDPSSKTTSAPLPPPFTDLAKPSRPPVIYYGHKPSSLVFQTADGLPIPFVPAQEAPLTSTLLLINEQMASPASTNNPDDPSKVRPNFIELPSTSSKASSSSSPSRSHSSSLSSSPKAKIGEGLKVLVVDDDQLTRKLMTRMLQRLGCEVQTAEDGQIAYSMMVYGHRNFVPSSGLTEDPDIEIRVSEDGRGQFENQYSIVFLDNQMPHLTGVELSRRLRKISRKDLIVGVTGNALLADQREYYDAGADQVLIKPVREESLREMLLLARSRSGLPMPATSPPSVSTSRGNLSSGSAGNFMSVPSAGGVSTVVEERT